MTQETAPAARKSVDFGQIIHNFAGIPLTLDGETVTLKLVTVAALLSIFPDEQDLTADQKFSRYALAKRAHAGTVDLTIEEIAGIKQAIGKGFAPVIMGGAFELLDAAKPVTEIGEKEYVETELAQEPPKSLRRRK